MSDIPKAMNWSYLAAFTDADGSITFQPKKYGRDIRVSWFQREQDSYVLTVIVEFLEKHGVHSIVRENQPGHFAVVCYRRTSVQNLLTKLEPRLIVKRQKAREALLYFKHRPVHGLVKDVEQTHCVRGHRWTRKTTYINPSGIRQCRTCGAENMRNFRLRQKVGE